MKNKSCLTRQDYIQLIVEDNIVQHQANYFQKSSNTLSVQVEQCKTNKQTTPLNGLKLGQTSV